MGGFKFEQCGNIEGLYLVEPQVFSDERGYNLEACLLYTSRCV